MSTGCYRLTFSLLRSAIQCIRSARFSCGHASKSPPPTLPSLNFAVFELHDSPLIHYNISLLCHTSVFLYQLPLSHPSSCVIRLLHTLTNPFSHTKFTRSRSKLSFGTGSTRMRLLRGNRTSHAHNHVLCKDADQMQPRERTQLHQPIYGTLLTYTSPPRPFYGFFFLFFFQTTMQTKQKKIVRKTPYGVGTYIERATNRRYM